jgi:hypothetical protein
MEQQSRIIATSIMEKRKYKSFAAKCTVMDIPIIASWISTVNEDISYLRNQAKDNLKKYIDERLAQEYEICLVGLNAIMKEVLNTAQNKEYKREKIQAL